MRGPPDLVTSVRDLLEHVLPFLFVTFLGFLGADALCWPLAAPTSDSESISERGDLLPLLEIQTIEVLSSCPFTITCNLDLSHLRHHVEI